MYTADHEWFLYNVIIFGPVLVDSSTGIKINIMISRGPIFAVSATIRQIIVTVV
jgi:hypothetical protein